MGDKKESLTEKLRSSIQASIDQSQLEHKRELFRRRLDLARAGLVKYDQHRITEAVRSFLTYLHILETIKKVPEGGLTPSCFDLKQDSQELLLISGIYWDLSKVFDRTTSPENIKDFRVYLQKFIIFSKGMPFQTLASETLRKYIRNEKPVHKAEFKEAYKAIGGSNCFVATSLVDHLDLEDFHQLRRFRDGALSRSSVGRFSIKLYQLGGPYAARALDHAPELCRILVAAVVKKIVKKITRFAA